MANLMLGFEQAHQSHVLQIASCLQNPYPVRNRLAVCFLNGGKVRSGAFDFWGVWHGLVLAAVNKESDLEDRRN